MLTLVLYTQAFAEPASSTPAEMISKYRVQHGEGRVTLDPVLNRIAQEQANAMASKQTLDHSVLAPFNSRVAYSGSGKNVRSVDWLGRAPKESITARRISGGCGQFEKLHRSHLLGNGDRRWGQTHDGNEQGRETSGNPILQNYNSWPLSVKKPTHVQLAARDTLLNFEFRNDSIWRGSFPRRLLLCGLPRVTDEV